MEDPSVLSDGGTSAFSAQTATEGDSTTTNNRNTSIGSPSKRAVASSRDPRLLEDFGGDFDFNFSPDRAAISISQHVSSQSNDKPLINELDGLFVGAPPVSTHMPRQPTAASLLDDDLMLETAAGQSQVGIPAAGNDDSMNARMVADLLADFGDFDGKNSGGNQLETDLLGPDAKEQQKIQEIDKETSSLNLETSVEGNADDENVPRPNDYSQPKPVLEPISKDFNEFHSENEGDFKLTTFDFGGQGVGLNDSAVFEKSDSGLNGSVKDIESPSNITPHTDFGNFDNEKRSHTVVSPSYDFGDFDLAKQSPLGLNQDNHLGDATIPNQSNVNRDDDFGNFDATIPSPAKINHDDTFGDFSAKIQSPGLVSQEAGFGDFGTTSQSPRDFSHTDDFGIVKQPADTQDDGDFGEFGNSNADDFGDFGSGTDNTTMQDFRGFEKMDNGTDDFGEADSSVNAAAPAISTPPCSAFSVEEYREFFKQLSCKDYDNVEKFISKSLTKTFSVDQNFDRIEESDEDAGWFNNSEDYIPKSLLNTPPTKESYSILSVELNSKYREEEWYKILQKIQFDLKDPEKLLNRFRWRRSAIRKRAFISMGIPINLDETFAVSNSSLNVLSNTSVPNRQRTGSPGVLTLFKDSNMENTTGDEKSSSTMGARSLSYEEEEMLDKAFASSKSAAVSPISDKPTGELAALGAVLSQDLAPSWDQNLAEQLKLISKESLSSNSDNELRAIRTQLKELLKQGEEIVKYHRAHSQRLKSENSRYNREIEDLVAKAKQARAAPTKSMTSSLRSFGWLRRT